MMIFGKRWQKQILEEIFTHDKIYNLKNILIVLDKNFRLKKYNNNNDGSRKFSIYEKQCLDD